MQYTRKQANHGSDIAAFYFDKEASFDIMGMMARFGDPNITDIAPSLQSYIVSYALTGNPNKMAAGTAAYPTVQWPEARLGNGSLENSLDVGDSKLSIVQDSFIHAKACHGWMEATKIRRGRN